MQILDKVQEIFNQYELKPLIFPKEHKDVYSYLRAYPEFDKDFVSEKTDGYFIIIYDDHIPNGWYGFDIGTPIIPAWCEIIDKILELCIASDPEFEIHQIKLMFGGIRFYTSSNVIEDLHEIEMLISEKLFDNALIY